MFDEDDDDSILNILFVFFVVPMLVWWYIQLSVTLLCYVIQSIVWVVSVVFYVIKTFVGYIIKLGRKMFTES